MPDLMEPRLASLAVRPAFTGRRGEAPRGRRAVDWLRDLAAAMIPGRGDPVVAQFADLAALAREPEEVRVALVRIAAMASGADRAELMLDQGGRPPRRLACWPPNAPAGPSGQAPSPPRGPIASGVLARARRGGMGPSTLDLAIRIGDTPFGTLRLTAPGRGRWPARVVRRLNTLCAIAGSAERGLGRPTPAPPGPPADPDQGPAGSTILGAFLSFALAQARRRREPLSIIEAAVDRLAALRELLGDEIAESAVDRIARAIRGTVRTSDVVVRLEDGRVAVLLPNASVENALRVAEAVRAAIARAGAASTTMPALTASIGVAAYPDHAQDLVSLRAACSTALTRAQQHGHDRIAEAPPADQIGSPGPARQRVG